MNEKTITEFLSNEYVEFAMYTIENRALPSVIDGFRSSQRKIIHTSKNIWKNGNEKSLKVFQLAGKVASDAYYHHSNTALEDTIVNMTQHFKNNAPLFIEDGQFGSLRSPKPGASRYIGNKLSKLFKHIYRDFDLLEYRQEEGETIEPYFFLPIVPTVLLNSSDGIAVGFSSNILNRDLKDIINACIKVLKGTNIRSVKPSLNDFNGVYKQDKENRKKWYIEGIFNRKNTTTVEIKELPPSITYEKYEEYLESLLNKKEIVDYEDNCKNDINYTIKFKRSYLSELSDEDLIKLLNLRQSTTEVYSTLDEKGHLKIFESSEDIIKYFVNFRLEYYEKRKKYQIVELENTLNKLENKYKFVNAIIEEKLLINNQKKSTIVSNIRKLSIEKINNSYDYLLKMPIYSLTKELLDQIKKDIKDNNQKLALLKKTKPMEIYLKDLQELKKIT